MSEVDDDERLIVEGLAAQLYVLSARGGHFAWWHLAKESVKMKFRKHAELQIAAFHSNTPF